MSIFAKGGSRVGGVAFLQHVFYRESCVVNNMS